MSHGEWTDATVTRLRQLWDDGYSTAEIGRRLGVSKNAVVGKAHRLDLPGRSSPIRVGSGKPRPPRRPPVPKLADLMPLRSLVVPSATIRAAPSITAAPAHAVAPVSLRLGKTPCCWPVGEPGAPAFRFCDALAIAGKPYCEAHCRSAYRKPRDRRPDAA